MRYPAWVSDQSAGQVKDPVRAPDRFLVFGAPDIRQAEIDEVVDSLRSGWLGTGPKVARFEDAFGAYTGAPFSVAVNSCTAALHLSLLASGVGPGDEVITTALTFCATVNAIIHAGATPVLADVDPATMNVDPADVTRRITPRTRAVVPVHFAGRPCDMGGLVGLAKQYELLLIEDCAHAIETMYRGRHVGTFGDFGCFSFYVTKNVVTGEGGMVVTPNAEHAARIKVLALHGMTKDAWRRFSDEGYRHYGVVDAGYKYNMMDIQAAIGIHQLDRVAEGARRREQLWSRYDEAFAELPIRTPATSEVGTVHARHLYTILVDEPTSGVARDEFLSRMNKQNVGVGVHYLSVPEHPYYRERFGWLLEDYPHAARLGRSIVSLPLSSGLTDDDADDVIEAVRRCLA